MLYPVQPDRAMPSFDGGPVGGVAVSYERGTPVGIDRSVDEPGGQQYMPPPPRAS